MRFLGGASLALSRPRSASWNFSGCRETGLGFGTVAVTPSAAAVASTGGQYGREQVRILPVIMPERELAGISPTTRPIVSKTFDTKADATKGGVLEKAIGPEGGSVKIQKENGRFQEERTYLGLLTRRNPRADSNRR